MGSCDNIGDMAKNNNEITDELIKNDEGVLSFYAGATVFITGATGFLGKAMVEKLLRSCENIDCIYILMRSKYGNSVEQRFKDFLKNMVFDKIRNMKPELLEKIKPIQGDVSELNIGLSLSDQELLSEKVNIVIHSAATIRFVETFSDALNLNTLATKRLLDLSHRFKNLKSFVYVSTAYSNPDIQHIEEKVYPAKHDTDTILQCVKAFPVDTINAMSHSFQGNHPNTYTYTKHLAEDIVLQNVSKLPICIVRPSIVTAAYNEPYPGWIDNLFGITGIAMEIYRGTVRTAIHNQNCIIDIVPVDFVVNTCITAAWHHRLIKNKEITVYNCTSGDVTNMTWVNFVDACVEIGRTNPTKYVMMYPNFAFTKNRLLNTFWEVFTHLLPCLFYDLWLRVQGKKPIMLKMAKRVKMALLAGEYFSLREWKFETDNFKSMTSALASNGENAYFPCDMSIFKWKEYMKVFILGIRKFILKDTMDSIPAARKKVQRLYIVQRILQAISGYYIFSILFRRK
ncbi:putative fatty acyl-CoA reductase CG5065 [Arctopsyche grandis]|uniref:putative fatty acyl-CoA reductase CG5065 n=1 Tax=Arctopsyche grandis TaxID=121162 RepID=UPI00406D9727